MNKLIAIALVATLLTAACESGGNGRQPSNANRGRSGGGNSGGSSDLRPEDIKPVTEPTLVSWYSLKTPTGRAGRTDKSLKFMHLINKAHPDSKKAIPISSFKKVLSDKQMGALLSLLREREFDRYAQSGLTVNRIPRGTANGAITVKRGGTVKTLVFKKGQTPDGSPVPNVYVKCRGLIIGVFNKADQYQVYTSEDERVLGIERLK